MKVSVLGSGSYGTALAYVLAREGRDVVMLCREAEQAEHINTRHHNPKRFKETLLPERITATTDLVTCLEGAELVLHCIPAQATYQFISTNRDLFISGVPYICTSKGIDKERGFMLRTIKDAFGDRTDMTLDKRADIPLGFLSGPSFAKEIMSRHLVSVVVASYDEWCLRKTHQIMSGGLFRVYSSTDVIGVEVGGALKNPLAIGAGIAKGLGFGQSTLAALVTRGTREVMEMIVRLGGRGETAYGLSGVGDIMLTCSSEMSRNFRFGELLAKGKDTEEALRIIGETVEGYHTSAQVVKIAHKHNINLPLFSIINNILNRVMTCEEALEMLMSTHGCEERFIG